MTIEKFFINRNDMERIALILSEIHGSSADEAYLNPGKWLATEGLPAESLIVVPEFKPKNAPPADPASSSSAKTPAKK
jgi:hypothetical protein